MSRDGFALAQAAAVTRRDDVQLRLEQPLHLSRPPAERLAWVGGLFSFYLVCSLGAVANVGIGSLVYEQFHGWWIAGIAGAIVGSVWNYVASGWLTWTRR